tara:strand:+ start:1067 stop:1258 length:192 start_codon:yes stop_codon:yes gene_type:complete
MAAFKVDLTEQQNEAIKRLQARWKNISESYGTLGCDDAIMVQVTGETGTSLWFVIEKDGYCHS